MQRGPAGADPCLHLDQGGRALALCRLSGGQIQTRIRVYQLREQLPADHCFTFQHVDGIDKSIVQCRT